MSVSCCWCTTHAIINYLFIFYIYFFTITLSRPLPFALHPLFSEDSIDKSDSRHRSVAPAVDTASRNTDLFIPSHYYYYSFSFSLPFALTFTKILLKDFVLSLPPGHHHGAGPPGHRLQAPQPPRDRLLRPPLPRPHEPDGEVLLEPFEEVAGN